MKSIGLLFGVIVLQASLAFGDFAGDWLITWSDDGSTQIDRLTQTGNSLQFIYMGLTGTTDGDTFNAPIPGTPYTLDGNLVGATIQGALLYEGSPVREYEAVLITSSGGTLSAAGTIASTGVDRTWTPVFAFDDLGTMKIAATLDSGGALRFAFRGVPIEVGTHEWSSNGNIDFKWRCRVSF